MVLPTVALVLVLLLTLALAVLQAGHLMHQQRRTGESRNAMQPIKLALVVYLKVRGAHVTTCQRGQKGYCYVIPSIVSLKQSHRWVLTVSGK